MISYTLNTPSEIDDFCFKFNLKYPLKRREFFKVLNLDPSITSNQLNKIVKITTNKMTVINQEEMSHDVFNFCKSNNLLKSKTVTPIINSNINAKNYRNSSDTDLILNIDELKLDDELDFVTISLNKDNIKILSRFLDICQNSKINNFILRTNNLSLSTDLDQLKIQLSLHKIKRQNISRIYFCPTDKHHFEWSYKTSPDLSGPRYIDIDVSNRCTHSCLFCGLYSSELIAKWKITNNSISKEITDIMKSEIDFSLFENIIKESFNATNICLGGMGDPLLHKDFIRMAEAISSKNINLQVFTNFSYLNHNQINEISSLASYDPNSINFIVNISAASAKIYTQVRPNQTQKDFELVTSNIKFASTLRKKKNRGIKFSLLSVINSLNYHELLLYPILAKELGAQEFWPKPLEIHSNEMNKYQLSLKQEKELARLYLLCTVLAEKLEIRIEYIDYFEDLIQKHNVSIPASQIEKELEEELLLHSVVYTDLINSIVPTKIETLYYHIPHEYFSTDEEFTAQDIHNHYLKDPIENFYDRHPCFIATDYIRFLVDGKVHSCCVSNIETGNLKKDTFRNIWNSSRIESFRKTSQDFPINKNTSTSDEWSFCKSCAHLNFNKKINFILSK